MSVKYKIKAIGKPGVAGGGEIKYYASINRGDKVNLRKILDEINELNVAHPGAVLGVLEIFLSRINYHLTDGRYVELDQLGTFYPSLSSSPSDTPEDVSKENIKRFKVLFRPSQLLRDRLSLVKFEKIANDSSSAQA
ncbi:MAG: hypothetical protein ACNS60_17420 [Candidatus Cyclobacteriaceae bacterium M2_1C_046]